MKPKEYVKKHGLGSRALLHNVFLADFAVDFQTMVEFHQESGDWNYTKFKNVVSDMRKKWDAINNRAGGVLPESLWKYFYATVVVALRDKMFGEELERRQREWEEKTAWERDFTEAFWRDMFGRVLNVFLKGHTPTAEIELLGLEVEPPPTPDEVTKAYRKLALVHHPDRGGDKKKFIEVTEAKNRVLAYAGKGQ